MMNIFNIAVNNYQIISVIWNLSLIIIPFFLAEFIDKLWQKNKFKTWQNKLSAYLLLFVWLLFIPNTAYIITDVRHLLNFCPENFTRVCIENAWMILFFFTYGLVGWLAFIYLLNQMQVIIARIKGRLTAYIFIWLVIPFISLGVMLGLINRWNSWEAFIYPGRIGGSASFYLFDFTYFKNWYLFTLFFYLFYFGGKAVLRRFKND